jgi:hypothetical protein
MATIERSVLRIDPPDVQQGMTPQHRVRPLMPAAMREDFAATDPFLALMEDWFPRYSPNTTTVGEPFNGIEPPLLPEVTATYCLPPALIGDDSARNRSTGVETVKLFSVIRVEDEELAVEIAGEEHVSRGGRDRGVHWRRPVHAPDELSRLWIDRVDPTRPLACRIVGSETVG